MLRINEIQEKFLHLIGWEQNISNSGPKVDLTLMQSESGMVYQQAHPLITLDNLASLAPDFKNEFPYDFKKQYSHGDIAYYGGKFYMCKKAVSNISPDGEVYSDSKDLHDYKNYLANSSFEAFDTDDKTLDLEFDGWGKNDGAVKIGVTSDAHCGEHAIVLRTRKGTTRLQSDFVYLESGDYTVSIYAKRLESLSEDPAITTDASVAMIGVRTSANPNNAEITFDYSDIYTPINESWIKLEYNFTLEEAQYASLIVRLKETLAADAVILAFDCAAIRDADVVITTVPTTPYVIGTRPNASDYWRECNPLSDWITGKMKASIIKVVTRFLNEKLAKSASKNIIENKTLFDGTGRLCDTIENRGRFVGFEVIPVRAKGVTTKINRIGLQFTKPGLYKIYIYHSSCEEPIYTFDCEKTKANSIEWFTLDNALLPYESSEMGIDAGGSWYICYKQDELPEGSEAINKNYDWSKGPCGSCSRHDAELWKAWSRWLEVHPFYSNKREDGYTITSYNGVQVIDNEKTDFLTFTNTPNGHYRGLCFMTQQEYSSIGESASGRLELRKFITAVDKNADSTIVVLNAYINSPTKPNTTKFRVFYNGVGSVAGSAGYKINGEGVVRLKTSILECLKLAEQHGVIVCYNACAAYASSIDNSTIKFAFDNAEVNQKQLVLSAVPNAGPLVFAPEDNIYTYDTNYGINLDVTVSCDLTDFIIEQRGIFQDVLLKQFGVDMLREFAYNSNTRTNRYIINASRTDILYELDGDSASMKKSGLNYQLDEAYKALQLSTQGLSRVCLPCVNNGIKYRTV